MSSHLRSLVAVTLTVSFTCGAIRAAELRTTSGDRTIFRTAELSSSQEVIGQDLASYIGGDHAEYIDAPCSSCGVAGCHMTCLSLCNWYANGEFLLWWRNGRAIPPLVTTDPVGTAVANVGILPGSTVIFGGETYGKEARPGGRLTLGKWLDDCESFGLEGRFWMLGENRVSFAADSAANNLPILALTYGQGAFFALSTPLAFPGPNPPDGTLDTEGNVQVESRSDVLGTDAMYRVLYMETDTTRFDILGGYHFSRIDEDLRINSFTRFLSTFNPGPIVANSTIRSLESFQTRNEFHGGLIGLSANYQNCQWQVDLLAKIAFGNMRQSVNISGTTISNVPPPSGAGIDTTTSNDGPVTAGLTGRRVRNEFAVVPELGAKLRYSLHECLDLSAGYSFVYWSDVVQPGDHLAPPNLASGSRVFTMNSGSYWVHGLNFGAEVRF